MIFKMSTLTTAVLVLIVATIAIAIMTVLNVPFDTMITILFVIISLLIGIL